MTRQELVEAVRQAGRKLGPGMSGSDFRRSTGISLNQVYKLFPEGGWNELRDLAGLARHPKSKGPLSDDDLLGEFDRVAKELGRIPTWALFGSKARISATIVRRRLGGVEGTLRRYRDWLEKNAPDSPLLAELQTRSRHETPVPPAVAVSGAGGARRWKKLDGPEYGPPIAFRGLRHAPINEQGVVFLFGIVGYELGFIVEAVHASYPDCEAKRCIDRARNRWQRVRIEFEYRSSNFRDHGHEPTGCDVVVCWEHDWVDCPIEVVELRRVIGELET